MISKRECPLSFPALRRRRVTEASVTTELAGRQSEVTAGCAAKEADMCAALVHQAAERADCDASTVMVHVADGGGVMSLDAFREMARRAGEME
jgi:hypothetical protein